MGPGRFLPANANVCDGVLPLPDTPLNGFREDAGKNVPKIGAGVPREARNQLLLSGPFDDSRFSLFGQPLVAAISDLEKLARYFGVPVNAFLPESNPKSRTNALLSARADLDDADLDEVRLYALFRKSRSMARHTK